MRISVDEVEHVALLSRLAMSQEEKERFAGQLSELLEAFAKLQELDTDGVEPTAHAIPVTNVLREDNRRPSLPREEVLMNAPDAVDGYFRVPRIVEED